jgi:hypothetical protein
MKDAQNHGIGQIKGDYVTPTFKPLVEAEAGSVEAGKLLPCPRCHHEADTLVTPRADGGTDMLVFCGDVDGCGIEIVESIGKGATFQLSQLIERWNARPSPVLTETQKASEEKLHSLEWSSNGIEWHSQFASKDHSEVVQQYSLTRIAANNEGGMPNLHWRIATYVLKTSGLLETQKASHLTAEGELKQWVKKRFSGETEAVSDNVNAVLQKALHLLRQSVGHFTHHVDCPEFIGDSAKGCECDMPALRETIQRLLSLHSTVAGAPPGNPKSVPTAGEQEEWKKALGLPGGE